MRLERDPVAAGEHSHCLHRGVGLGADHHQRAVTGFELAAATGNEDGEDDVGHFGNIGHQREHHLALDLDHFGFGAGAHRQVEIAAREERDLADELGRADGAGQIALAGEWIDDLDLALLDIDEAVHRRTRLGDHRTGGVGSFVADIAQRCDMVRLERGAGHDPQVAGDRFHASLLNPAYVAPPSGNERAG